MGRSRHDQQTLVVRILPAGNLLIGLLAEVAAMCTLKMDGIVMIQDLRYQYMMKTEI